MARLAQIADNLGIADARQQALTALESALTPWLQVSPTLPPCQDG